MIVVAASLIAIASFATAANCPPNINHCQEKILGGLGAQVEAQWGIAVTIDSALQTTGGSPTTGVNGLLLVAPGASAHVWVNVSVTANSSVVQANATLAVNATAGLSFTNASYTVLATQTPQNLSFPFSLDADATPGDIMFIPVRLEHLDESALATTHVPFEVGGIQAAAVPDPTEGDEGKRLILFASTALGVGFLLGFVARIIVDSWRRTSRPLGVAHRQRLPGAAHL